MNHPLQDSSEKASSNGNEAQTEGGCCSLGDGGRAGASSSAQAAGRAGRSTGSHRARWRGSSTVTTRGGRTVTGQGRVGNSWLHGGVVGAAGGVGRQWAGVINANSLQLGALRWDDGSWGRAAVTEETVQSISDDGEIRLCDTEGSSGYGYLLDEVSDFSIGQIHEPVAVSRKLRAETRATYL